MPDRAANHLANLADAINAALPQTQCTRCGWPDCAGYAQAIAAGEAAINQCPPGGQEGIARLAAITGKPALPLNPEYGVEGPRHLAVIDEDWCIGCTLCFKACPTDAIAGGNKTMHVVLDAFCTGCELCIPVCPVDCISLVNVTGSAHGWQAWSPEQARTAQARYAARAQRLGLRPGQALPPLQQRTGLQKQGVDAQDCALPVQQPLPAGDGHETPDTGDACDRREDGVAIRPALAVAAGTADAALPADDAAQPANKAALLAAIMAKAKAKRGQTP